MHDIQLQSRGLHMEEFKAEMAISSSKIWSGRIPQQSIMTTFHKQMTEIESLSGSEPSDGPCLHEAITSAKENKPCAEGEYKF
jgi:hypothetical protein